MALDSLFVKHYPTGRRKTRYRTSYGHMHNWLHSDLSGHNLSTYRDPDARRLKSQDVLTLPEPQADEEEELKLPQLSQRDLRREGLPSNWAPLPVFPSPRAHDMNPPVYMKYSGPKSGKGSHPRLRNGKGGASWRHLKFPLEPNGDRGGFVDGQVAVTDRLMPERCTVVAEPIKTPDRVAQHRRLVHRTEAAKVADAERWKSTRLLIF